MAEAVKPTKAKVKKKSGKTKEVKPTKDQLQAPSELQHELPSPPDTEQSTEEQDIPRVDPVVKTTEELQPDSQNTQTKVHDPGPAGQEKPTPVQDVSSLKEGEGENVEEGKGETVGNKGGNVISDLGTDGESALVDVHAEQVDIIEDVGAKIKTMIRGPHQQISIDAGDSETNTEVISLEPCDGEVETRSPDNVSAQTCDSETGPHEQVSIDAQAREGETGPHEQVSIDAQAREGETGFPEQISVEACDKETGAVPQQQAVKGSTDEVTETGPHHLVSVEPYENEASLIQGPEGMEETVRTSEDAEELREEESVPVTQDVLDSDTHGSVERRSDEDVQNQTGSAVTETVKESPSDEFVDAQEDISETGLITEVDAECEAKDADQLEHVNRSGDAVSGHVDTEAAERDMSRDVSGDAGVSQRVIEGSVPAHSEVEQAGESGLEQDLAASRDISSVLESIANSSSVNLHELPVTEGVVSSQASESNQNPVSADGAQLSRDQQVNFNPVALTRMNIYDGQTHIRNDPLPAQPAVSTRGQIVHSQVREGTVFRDGVQEMELAPDNNSGYGNTPSTPAETSSTGTLPVVSAPVLDVSPSSSAQAVPVEELPLTDEQLSCLYHNPELRGLESSVDKFIQEATVDRHEFHELVLNYFRACNNLLGAEHDLEALTAEYRRLRDAVWLDKPCSVTGQGQCSDRSKVVGEFRYIQAEFDRAGCDNLSRSMKDIRTHIQDSLSLHAYSVQISKLQVISYLCDMYNRCPAFHSIPPHAPVQFQHDTQVNLELAGQLDWLRECISILFNFQRKPTKSTIFIKDTRAWIEMLVSVLLRLASFSDHQYLLNQVLRCPAGVGSWASHLVQCTCPRAGSSVATMGWGSPLLDHAVCILALICTDVRGRDDFLHQFQALSTPVNSEQAENPWIMVDSDGDEDEDPVSGWRYLLEADLISLLNQLPLADICRHVLLIGQSEGRDVYNVHLTSEAGMMKLYAFTSRVIQLLGQGLKTYCMARYKQLNKHIGHMIKDTVGYVSDHWENMGEAYRHMPQSTSQKLQAEFDQFFFRATQYMLGAPKLGCWQFMSDLPYRCVSSRMMWRLLYRINTSGRPNMEPAHLASVEHCQKLCAEPETRRVFEERLVSMANTESVYLLTSLANMARARGTDDDAFIETVTMQIFEISYLSTHTREFCSKVGRDLLASISMVHPFILPRLMHKLGATLPHLGNMALYLCRDLPWSLCVLGDPELNVLRHWLLSRDLTSTEHLLAREILQAVNWGAKPKGSGLQISVDIQRRAALLLVEVYSKHIKDRHMASLITEGFKIAASTLMAKMTAEQVFTNWLWEVVLQFHLHVSQQRHLVGEEATNWAQSVPSLHSEGAFYSLQKGVKSSCSLVIYLTLLMTNKGHCLSEFCTQGLDLLCSLVDQHHYIPAIRILACVIPLFKNNTHYLINNDRLLHVLQVLLSGDYSQRMLSMFGWDFPGPVTKLFSSMQQDMLKGHHALGEESGSDGAAQQLLTWWFTVLTNIKKWQAQRDILYVLDNLIKFSYQSNVLWRATQDFFIGLNKELIKSHRESGLFSSIASWLGAGGNLPTYIETNSCWEFPWFSYMVLHAECMYEAESGIWSGVQEALVDSDKTTVDQAIKKSCSAAKAGTPWMLGVYRWGYLALEAHVSHPLMPLIWQRFFLLYLGRPSLANSLPNRGGLGNQLFASSTYQSLRKQMKHRLQETADHFHKLQQEADTPSVTQDGDESRGEFEEEAVHVESVQHTREMQFRDQLIRLYQTLSFWLDEPRLHDPNLYLPALPQEYDSERLLKLFQNQWEPWSSHVDTETINKSIKQSLSEWQEHLLGAAGKRNQVETPRQDTPTERILNRLRQQETPKPPPPVTLPQSSIPAVDKNILLKKESLLYALKSDFIAMLDFADVFCSHVSKNVGLDYSYCEMLPELYKNQDAETTISVPCTSKFNPTHRCTGPAAIQVKFKCKVVNEIARRRLEENRVEYKQLLIYSQLPPPQDVCSAAVHVRNTVMALVDLHEHASSGDERRRAMEVGIALFYHISNLVTEQSRFYPPTCQFFSSCVETLGLEFIRKTPSQSQPVLQTILKSPLLAGMLGPNFLPNNNPGVFISMYSDIIKVPANQGADLAFTLLSKFDVKQWLVEARPTLSERSSLVSVIGQALCVCGSEVDDNCRLVFEMYRTHIQIVLRHQFPDHFGDVLKALIKGSNKESISPVVWQDVLHCLGCVPQEEGTTSPVPPQNPMVLPANLAKETLLWLAQYFRRERTSSVDSASFGLYPKWRTYSPYLASLLGAMCGISIISAANTARETRSCEAEKVVDDLWSLVSDTFLPWLQPLDNSGQILSPWVEADAGLAGDMVAAFAENIDCLQDQFQAILPPFAMGAFNLLWPYYVNTLIQEGTPEHVLRVFHARLSTLAWTQFIPSMPNVELMVQVLEQGPRCCSVFLGHILPAINWSAMVTSSLTNDPPEVINRLHVCLFTLLVKLGQNKAIIQSQDFSRLLQRAAGYAWQYLDANNYEAVSSWFLSQCDYECVVIERSAPEAKVTSLLKSAAEFIPPPGRDVVPHPETPLKRCLFVRSIVQLICQHYNKPEVNPDQVGIAVTNLITEVETVIATVTDPNDQTSEAISLCSEVLHALNNCNPRGPTPSTLHAVVVKWLQHSPNSPLLMPMLTAASRTLASLEVMAQLMETCMEVHFYGDISTVSANGGWNPLLAAFQVPDLNTQEFLSQCIHQGAYMVLYVYLLQQLPLTEGTQEEVRLLLTVTDWVKRVKPSPTIEARLFLWWDEALKLLQKQISSGTELEQLAHCAKNLSYYLSSLGEDKASTGFLGSIGFGKKSQLSVRFRLVCKVMSAFLLAQVESDSCVRVHPGATGVIQSRKPSSPGRTKTVSPAMQAFVALDGLKTNKLYTPHVEDITHAVDFIQNPQNTLRDCTTLLKYLRENLFPDKVYLHIPHL